VHTKTFLDLSSTNDILARSSHFLEKGRSGLPVKLLLPHEDIETAKFILEKAHQLWKSFQGDIAELANSRSGGRGAITPCELFYPWKEASTWHIAQEFFEFCEEQCKDTYGGRVKFLFVNPKDLAEPGDDPHKVSRWYLFDGDPTVFVLKQEHFIGTHWPSRDGKVEVIVNPYPASIWLVLHEVGHLVLHKQQIVKRMEKKVFDPNYGPPANEDEEAQAWYFASCVMGLAISFIGWDGRLHRRQDVHWYGAPWQDLTWIERIFRPDEGSPPDEESA
jgi:hypothetical protein